MPDSTHLDKILDMRQWEALHYPKFLPHIPFGTIGIASAESSVLQKRLHVHLSYILEEGNRSCTTGKILTQFMLCKCSFLVLMSFAGFVSLERSKEKKK